MRLPQPSNGHRPAIRRRFELIGGKLTALLGRAGSTTLLAIEPGPKTSHIRLGQSGWLELELDDIETIGRAALAFVEEQRKNGAVNSKVP